MAEWTFVSCSGVWREAKLSFEAKAMWHLLATYRHHETGKCNPSIATLSKITGYCREKVCRLTVELEAAGAIKKVWDRSKGRFGSFHYVVASPVSWATVVGNTVVGKADFGNPNSNSNPLGNSNPSEEQGSLREHAREFSLGEFLEIALEVGAPQGLQCLEAFYASEIKAVPHTQKRLRNRVRGFAARVRDDREKERPPKDEPRIVGLG